jgi:cytochrome c biogenesis protein CcmG/thiol:disulfide interchange protein DsbE
MSAQEDSQQQDTGGSHWGKRLLFLLPVAAFLVVAGYFAWGLLSDRNPREVPSALVGQAVPQFDLPPVEGLEPAGLATADVTGAERPVLLNVFASWCGPCRVEHPILMRLAEREGIKVFGIAYKDKPADTRRFIENLGNPYQRIGADRSGRIGIELGVSGVPETYIVGPSGEIRYKHTGPITGQALRDKILPLLRKLGA